MGRAAAGVASALSASCGSVETVATPPNGRQASADTFGAATPAFTERPAQGGRLLRFAAVPERGFHSPYFLFVPTDLPNDRAVVIHGPNNIITSDQDKLEQTLLGMLEWMTQEWGVATQTPLLMPAFIRPPAPGFFHERRGKHDNLYTHALVREALETDKPGLERLDLQIFAMFDHALERLEATGTPARAKPILTGWSAAGTLADRLCILHPERVRAVIGGGFGATPVLPVETLQGERLQYPVGVADLPDLVGHAFNHEAYNAVPFLLLHGTDDPNDPIPDVDPLGLRQRAQTKRLLGDAPMERIDTVRRVMANAGKSDFEIKLYEGVGHAGSRDIARDIVAAIWRYA